MQNMQGDESKGYPARRSLFTVNNELRTEDNRSSDIKLESTMVESVDNYPISSMDPPIRKDEVLVRDLVMQDSESWDLVSGTALEVPPLIPKPEIPCPEPEFSLQISNARHTKSEGVYFLGTGFLCLLLSVCFDNLHDPHYHFTTSSSFFILVVD
jgi:hypothetical protein